MPKKIRDGLKGTTVKQAGLLNAQYLIIINITFFSLFNVLFLSFASNPLMAERFCAQNWYMGGAGFDSAGFVLVNLAVQSFPFFSPKLA